MISKKLVEENGIGFGFICYEKGEAEKFAGKSLPCFIKYKDGNLFGNLLYEAPWLWFFQESGLWDSLPQSFQQQLLDNDSSTS